MIKAFFKSMGEKCFGCMSGVFCLFVFIVKIYKKYQFDDMENCIFFFITVI